MDIVSQPIGIELLLVLFPITGEAEAALHGSNPKPGDGL